MTIGWYYYVSDAQHGPVAQPELEAALAAFPQWSSTLVWREGFANWRMAGDVADLRVSPAPPDALPPIPLLSPAKSVARVPVGRQWQFVLVTNVLLACLFTFSMDLRDTLGMSLLTPDGFGEYLGRTLPLIGVAAIPAFAFWAVKFFRRNALLTTMYVWTAGICFMGLVVETGRQASPEPVASSSSASHLQAEMGKGFMNGCIRSQSADAANRAAAVTQSQILTYCTCMELNLRGKISLLESTLVAAGIPLPWVKQRINGAAAGCLAAPANQASPSDGRPPVWGPDGQAGQ